MSTFKVQPVYAELTLGWLDATAGSMAVHCPRDVLRSVNWNFRGGTLGAYPMRFPTETSGDSYPDGPSSDLAECTEWDPNWLALTNLLRNRAAESRRSVRSHADWTYSFAVAKAVLQDARADDGPEVRIQTGLHGVYIVARRMWETASSMRPGPQWEKLSAYMVESAAASAAGSLMHVPDAMAAARRSVRALGESMVPALHEILGQFDSVMYRTGSQEARQRARARGRSMMAGDCPAAVLADGPAPIGSAAGIMFSILHGCCVARVGVTVVAMSRSDMVRLHQLLTAIASGVTATICQAAVAPGPERQQLTRLTEAISAQITRLLLASASVPAGDEVQVCKGFKRAFTYFLGTLAGPLSHREAEVLWAETLETPYIDPSALRAWVQECRGWSAGTAFNLGKLYKLCPAPDACPASTLLDRHEMVCNRNEAEPEALADLATVLRDQILRAYIRKPGVRLEPRAGVIAPTWLAAYRAGRLDEVPTTSIHEHLAWEGTAAMPDRVADDPSVWKDSGLGWDSVEEAFDPDRVRTKGNMLVRMMTDNSAPMPGTPHMHGPHDHKIDTKPEGHKNPARGIYSGNLSDRLDQSWMEVAVEQVAVHHPSFMIGADLASREERVRAIVDRNMHAGFQDVYYSFDIAGWSPRMDPAIQEASHSIWATLYDSELFRSASAINCGARIYMNKAGFKGWFRNPGANLEGYNGKEMTMVLVALLARAVNVWRRSIVAKHMCTRQEASKWAALLLAYIDDGLAKLTLPADRVIPLFSEFQACTVTSFAACGYTVEISKCFPSDRFAIFLNEPYLAGRHVVHGTRAAMTICAENTEEHTSLLERVTAVSTGCRGAVMSGLDALAGTLLQAYHVYRHLAEWIRNPSPVAAAVWSFAPRCWGGLGLPTALQLGTSGGGAASEEGVQTLQKWSQISPACRAFFLSSSRSAMRPRTAMGTLISPLGGRLEAGPMVESRIPDAVRDGLQRMLKAGRLSTMARGFLAYASAPAMEEFAARILPVDAGAVVQEQLLLDIASTHPHHLFSSFARRVEKSSTLISLVGPRQMRRIIRDNRRDASESYHVARLRCIST